jgi:hypothetical protein
MRKHYTKVRIQIKDDLMKSNRLSNLVKTWIPLVIISAAIPFILGSLLDMPQDKAIIASVLAAVVAISGFLLRPYFIEEKKERSQRTDNRYP